MAISKKVEVAEERSNDEVLHVKNTADFVVCNIQPGKEGQVTYGQYKTFVGLVEIK